MTAIATVTGHVIDFLNPDPAEINLDDIAAGLASAPRYCGQTIRPYSVLQHSLLVCALVAPENRLHALLHDAPEAYTCDVPSPLKRDMRAIATLTGHQSPYDVIEHNIWKAICRRWDMSPDLPVDVVRADQYAMSIEAPVLQPEGWKRGVWDFARSQADGARHWAASLELLLETTRSTCVGAWLTDVASELTNRRAAA